MQEAVRKEGKEVKVNQDGARGSLGRGHVPNIVTDAEELEKKRDTSPEVELTIDGGNAIGRCLRVCGV